MRWTTGFLERKFDRVAVMPPAHTKLAFVGDKAEFQNGFGAWQRVRYTCIYDPLSESVTSVTVSER